MGEAKGLDGGWLGGPSTPADAFGGGWGTSTSEAARGHDVNVTCKMSRVQYHNLSVNITCGLILPPSGQTPGLPPLPPYLPAATPSYCPRTPWQTAPLPPLPPLLPPTPPQGESRLTG